MRGSMFIKFFKKLDYFLPIQLTESIPIELQYRSRLTVLVNLILFLIHTLVLPFFYFTGASSVLLSFLLLSYITLLGHLYFLKFQPLKLEENLTRGAIINTLIPTLLLYTIGFSNKGMGFFGLIWLIPIFLVNAFFFKTRISFSITLFNFIVYLGFTALKFETFFDPIKNNVYFSKVYYVILTIVLIMSYLITFIFVHINENLQSEISNQKDLLLDSAKFQSLGKMASNLAHDINNPLFTIQGKLHQIRHLLSKDELDLHKCDQIVNSVENTILKLSQIVKGISTFAREGAGDQMVSINASDLIESTLVLTIDKIENAGIILEQKIDPNLTIICYPSFISQIILNLISNAIDALDFANVKKIDVSAHLENGYVFIAICDSGPGVSKQNEAKIFDPFFTTKTFGKGVGIGLSISKGLVEFHDGELLYERVNSFSRFIIKLPNYE